MARANNHGKSRKIEVVISPALDDALQEYMAEHGINSTAAAGRKALAEMIGRPELGTVRSVGRPRKKADPAHDNK